MFSHEALNDDTQELLDKVSPSDAGRDGVGWGQRRRFLTVFLQMLAEDAEAGAEDEKEVEELKKQGINPLPKPPPGVGLLPTPPRPIPMDTGPGLGDFGCHPGPNQVSMVTKGPPVSVAPPIPNQSTGPPILCPDGGPFQGGPPPNPAGPPPHMGPPPPGGGESCGGKKIPSLFDIKVQPTGQLAQKLAVRYQTRKNPNV